MQRRRATLESKPWSGAAGAVMLLAAACTSPVSEPATPSTTARTQPPPEPTKPPEQPKQTERPKQPEPFAKDDRAAVARALATAWGREPGDDACIEWPASFPRVVAVGSFASDRGCEAEGLFVDRTFIASRFDAAGLATRDFAKAPPDVKETLARAWVDEVVHAFGGGFVSEPHAAFSFEGGPAFTPPKVEGGTDVIVVDGWVQEPPGMSDESSFYHVTYAFSREGELATTTANGFTIEGQRLRDRVAELAAKPATPTYAVDMSAFDLGCKRNADCTNVRPSPCGRCGCSSTPLAVRERERFQAALGAIACPPATPVVDGSGCGGCPGYRARCDHGTCVVETH